MAQTKTKYTGVYKDEKGNFFYQTELGIDKITGKRIRKKGRKDKNGKLFSSAVEAYKELTRIKNEYHETQGYSNYRMSYKQYMDSIYIPYYQSTVDKSTFSIKKKILEDIRDRFSNTLLRSISLEQVQNYRIWLLTSEESGGPGYSQSYASLIFGAFRKSLDFALTMGYVEQNISKRVKAIPKGNATVPYWTKSEFEAVISKIYIGNIYEHLNFIMLWIYFMTGIRVNEGCALKWNDVDFKNKKLRIHNMLIIQSKENWTINPYTKTKNGKRTISLDSDTISILKKWKKTQKTIGLGNEDDFIFGEDNLSSENNISVNDKNENNDNSYSRKTNRVKSDLPDLSYNPHPKDNRNRFGEKPTKKEIENFMNFSKRDEIEYTEDKVILGTDSELDNSHFDEIKNAKI